MGVEKMVKDAKGRTSGKMTEDPSAKEKEPSKVTVVTRKGGLQKARMTLQRDSGK